MSFDKRRLVQCRASSVVIDDQPRLVPVRERHAVYGSERLYRGEHRERVIEVVRAPRRQCLFDRRHRLIFLGGGRTV